MGLTPKNDLSIVEIVYYTPALFLSLFICYRHGFGRQLGWIFLVLLSLIRIIGSSTGIAATNDPTNTGLLECSAILTSVGLTPLLLAMLGLLKRVNEGMRPPVLKPLIFPLLQIIPVLGLILAINGGVDSFNSDPDKQSKGHTYQRVAVIIFVVFLVIETAITGLTFTKLSHAIPGEKRLWLAALASIPFLFVRLIYSLISVFEPYSSTFGIQATSNASAIVSGCMAVLMEFIVVAIYLAAGLTVRKIERSQVRTGQSQPMVPLQKVPRQTQYAEHQGGQQQGMTAV